MSVFDPKNAGKQLPPMPGALPKAPEPKKEIQGTPVVIYIGGKPIEMSKAEALVVMAQITQILIFMEQPPLSDNPEQEVVKNGENK